MRLRRPSTSLLIVLACALAAAPATAQDAAVAAPVHPATKAQIHEYYQVTHQLELAHSVMNKMLDGMQATAAPYLVKAFWDDMRESFAHFDLEGFLVPAIQKYISEEDMTQVLTFYKTSAGQHFLIAQPLITAASQAAVREAGGKIGQEAYERHKVEIEAAKAKMQAAPAAPDPSR